MTSLRIILASRNGEPRPTDNASTVACDRSWRRAPGEPPEDFIRRVAEEAPRPCTVIMWAS